MSEVFSCELTHGGYRILFLGTPDQVGSAVLGKAGVTIPKATIQAKVEAASKAMAEWPRA